MKKRAIIIAAGKATRWKDYRGLNKHFIEVDGEPIIHRTVRLLKKNKVDEIFIVGKDDRYKIEGTELYIPKFTPEYHDADKFLSSKDLWLRDKGKTLVIYGDCYFTEHAIQTIVNHKHKDWLLFARPWQSDYTSGCGECFAQTFYPGQVAEHERALYKLIEYYNKGRLDRIGGWEHYRIMAGIPESHIHKHWIGDRFVLINDWSDDFDRPSDYDNFMSRRKIVQNSKITINKAKQYLSPKQVRSAR